MHEFLAMYSNGHPYSECIGCNKRRRMSQMQLLLFMSSNTWTNRKVEEMKTTLLILLSRNPLSNDSLQQLSWRIPERNQEQPTGDPIYDYLSKWENKSVRSSQVLSCRPTGLSCKGLFWFKHRTINNNTAATWSDLQRGKPAGAGPRATSAGLGS